MFFFKKIGVLKKKLKLKIKEINKWTWLDIDDFIANNLDKFIK